MSIINTRMVRYYNKWENYFLSIYDDYPKEIKKKMRNLLFINALNLIGWIFIFFIDGFNRYINNFNIITVLRDFIILGLIILTFVLIKLEKPLLAGYSTIIEVLALAIHPIVLDLLSTYSSSADDLYKTLCFLIIGELLINAYAIKRSQILVYSLLSFIFLFIHFWILLDIFYGGQLNRESSAMIFESVFLLLSSTILSFFLFTLTLRSRMEIIKNIIFFKMGEKGPIPFFTEHHISYNSLIQSGVYFYTAIGQGSQYQTGLFGPVPFGKKKEKVALIYSSIVVDSEFKDSRLKEENYLIITLIAEKNEVNLINRGQVSRLLDDLVNKIDDLAKLEEKDIQKMIESVRNQ